MFAPDIRSFSPEDYLAREAKSAIKHEYRDGEVVAMAGATDTHVTIAGNLFVELRSHLRGSGCRVFIADMKAWVESRNSFFYPDLLVTCDPRDGETPVYKRFPKTIVEVLSGSTEAYDRGRKFEAYQAIDTLEEYVLINTQHQRVESFRRQEGGLWMYEAFEPGDRPEFRLESLDYIGRFAALYEDVTLEPSEDFNDEPRPLSEPIAPESGQQAAE